MKVIIPSQYSIAYTNAVDEAYPQWSPAVTYNVNDYVIYSYKIYVSLAGANLNNVPDVSPTFWQSIGSVNSRRMFDIYLNTATSNADNLTVKLNLVRTSCVSLMNVSARQITANLRYNGAIIWTETVDLFNNDSYSWSDYFFNEHTYRNSYIAHFPMYLMSELELIITNPNNTAIVGLCFVGNAKELGKTLYTPKIGIRDYSRKNTDEWGNTYLVQGYSSQEISCDVFVPSANADNVWKTLNNIRATPAIFDFNNSNTNYESLVVYGWFDDFSINLQTTEAAALNINIKGLI